MNAATSWTDAGAHWIAEHAPKAGNASTETASLHRQRRPRAVAEEERYRALRAAQEKSAEATDVQEAAARARRIIRALNTGLAKNRAAQGHAIP
jgi:hypothetical protein